MDINSETNYENWKSICEQTFGFLKTQFGFSPYEQKHSGNYIFGLKNKTTRFEIVIAPSRLEFEIYIGKVGEEKTFNLLELVVVHGAKIKFPGKGFLAHIQRDEPLGDFDVDYEKTLRVDDPRDLERLRGALIAYGKLVRDHVLNIMSGDFELFADVEMARTKGPILPF